LLWANPIYAKLKPAIQEATERYIVKDYPTHYNTATAEKETSWQVLRVALLFPILGRVLPRDLSPLKPILVEGAWDRVRSRLVPSFAGGAS
jgi:hypothetical protein